MHSCLFFTVVLAMRFRGRHSYSSRSCRAHRLLSAVTMDLKALRDLMGATCTSMPEAISSLPALERSHLAHSLAQLVSTGGSTEDLRTAAAALTVLFHDTELSETVMSAEVRYGRDCLGCNCAFAARGPNMPFLDLPIHSFIL